MGDYFETDYVKDYDGALVRRILTYLKPHAPFVVFVFIALAVTTVSELAVPVLQQRLLDRHILARYIAFDLAALPPAADGAAADKAADGAAADSAARLSYKTRRELSALQKKGGVVLSGRLFVNEDSRLHLSGAAEKELREAGVLDDEKWYVFQDAAAGGALSAVRIADLDTLSAEERARVKASSTRALGKTALLLLAALFVTFTGAFVQVYFSNLTGQRIMKNIRLQLYQKTLTQSSAFLSRHPTGRIVSRLTSDVETINDFFTSVLTAFLKDFSIMIGTLITLFILSPKLAAAAVLCMPPVLAVTIISRVKARSAFRDQRAATSALNAYLSEHLSGMKIVRLFRTEEKSAREFNKLNSSLLGASLREIYIFGVFRPSVEFIATFTTAVVIAAGSVLVLRLSLSIGVLIAFINLIQMFFMPVMDIAEKYTMLQSALAGAERVFMLLDTDSAIPDAGKTEFIEGEEKTLTNTPAIEFRDVHFSYETGEPVLKGLSFSVYAGETAAITGPSGAGKTTITNLISRLWDINGGAILLCGRNARDYRLDSLRRAALPVLQDVFLFSMTVAENISLGLPLTRRQIEEAARAVYAHDFIQALPEGYNTRLSEGAANISQGQRQLISFARALAHNPSVVILDEATSSVDTETETLIQLGLKRVLRGRTSVVIAHRLSTIRDANRIFVISGGALAEEGVHANLMRSGGLYATLYQLQFEE